MHIDYHVVVHGSWYSVPYTLIGEKVEVCLTLATVAILHNGSYSGGMVDALGYPGFFVLTSVLGVPVLLLVTWAGRRLAPDAR